MSLHLRSPPPPGWPAFAGHDMKIRYDTRTAAARTLAHVGSRGHRRAMLGVYIGGILIAGSLAFAPGRIMHSVVFGS